MTIRRSVVTTILAAATLGALGTTAMAADIIQQPQIIEAPVIKEVKPFGGWYIRGDVGYAFSDARKDSDKAKELPVAPGVTTEVDSDFEDIYSVGGGVGYQLNDFLRADITVDGFFNGEYANTTTSTIDLGTGAPITDETAEMAEFNALMVMANAYVDLGTYAGITPYVGAGVGFASLDYDQVKFTANGEPVTPSVNGVPTNEPEGSETLRLAWSLSAGASYDVSDNIALDGGYRFTRIADGEYRAGVNDGGVDLHQVRIGARYKIH